MSPITVVQAKTGFRVVDGWSRVQACRRLHRSDVDAIVLETEDGAAVHSIVSRHARIPTKPCEWAHHFKRILDRDPMLTITVAAERCNVSVAFIEQRLKLLDLEQSIAVMVDAGRICVDNAAQLARLPKDEQVAWINSAIEMNTFEFAKMVESQIRQRFSWDRCATGKGPGFCKRDIGHAGPCAVENSFTNKKTCKVCMILIGNAEIVRNGSTCDWCTKTCPSCNKRLPIGDQSCHVKCETRGVWSDQDLTSEGKCLGCRKRACPAINKCEHKATYGKDDKTWCSWCETQLPGKKSPAERGKVLCLEPGCKKWIKDARQMLAEGKRILPDAWFCKTHRIITTTRPTGDGYAVLDIDRARRYEDMPHVDRDGDPIWVTAQFEVKKLRDMELSHLLNVIAMLERNERKQVEITGCCETHPKMAALKAEVKSRAKSCDCDDGIAEGDEPCKKCAMGKERQAAKEYAKKIKEGRNTKLVLAVFVASMGAAFMASARGQQFLQMIFQYLQ